MSRAANPAIGAEVERVYVWQIPVRVTHWLIAGSIVVLAATGLFIGNPIISVPGEARQSFVMGWVRTIHLWFAWVFIGSVVVRLIWMFTGNRYARWNAFVPAQASRRRGLLPTLKFYLFMRDAPPGFVGHNPVAGATYILVFGLYLLAILTGLTMYAPYADVGSPLRAFAGFAPWLGGFQTARWIHHVVMWLLLGFAAHHIYSGWLMSIVEKNGTMESIFSGYKWVRKSETDD